MQNYLFTYCISVLGTCKRLAVNALASALVAAVLISPAAFAQSDSSNADSADTLKALEESLQREKEELERAVTERESLLSDQEKIRDELEAERKALEEKQQRLLELCEKHNDANPNSPLDCEKELEG